jgi:hypothetical protein
LEAEILEQSAKDSDMTAAAQTTLRDYAAAEWPRLNHKARLAKLARRLPWSDRRVRAIYNGEAGVSLRAGEQADLDALIGEARHEYRDLAQLAASLHALLYGPDADFYRPQVDAIREALVPQGRGSAQGGGRDGAGDFGATPKRGEAA